MKSAAAVVIALMIWTVGLLAFTARIERSTPAAEPAGAQAMVVLTGASTERITAAMRLLEQGKAQRLLVSGVNQMATRDDIRTVARAARRIYDCCVDLGFKAENTVGNASETAAWARGRGYDDLIVVTADYHMPRAMLELKAVMPEAQLTAYPVRTEELDVRRWWRTGGAARRTIVEYTKYLAILAREAVLSLGPKDAPQTAAEAAQTAPTEKAVP